MEITHRKIDAIVIIDIEGRLAIQTTPSIKSYTDPFVEDPSVKGMAINGKNIEFIDSSGIGMLAGMYKRLKDHKKPFTIFGLNEMNREVLGMINLDAYVSIFNEEREALEFCKK